MRISQIDSAKFIAIFFVIVSHSSLSSAVAPFLFAFHVQLFFICYGYVCKDRNLSVSNYILGGGKSLMYRFMVTFVLLSLIFGPPLSLPYLIRVLFYGRTAGVIGTEHLWFLPCFFLSALIFNILIIATRREIYRFGIVCVLGVISSFLCYESNICINLGSKVLHLTGYGYSNEIDLYWGFPYTFNVSLTGCVLMYIGLILRKVFERFKVIEKKRLYIPVGFVCLLVGSVGYYINQSLLNNDFVFKLITMSHAIYGNYLLFLLVSTCLTITTICIACHVNNALFSRYGKETMAIYAFHPFIMGIVGFAFSILCIPDFDGIIKSVFTILICCLLIPIIRKIDPALVGVRK